MKISKIILRPQTSAVPDGIAEEVELSPEQGALIPQVDDVFIAPGHNCIVRARQFEFRNGVLIVFLLF